MKTLLLSLLFFTSTTVSAKIILVDRDIDVYRDLGGGYDSRKDKMQGICVGYEKEASQPHKELASGSFDLSLESKQETIANKLGVSMNGRYTTGATTATAAAEFLNDSTKNEFSLSYTYVAEFQYKEILEAGTHDAIIPMEGFKNIVKKSKEFYNVCGDEYVRAHNKAARALVNINVSFVSKEEKNRFAATVGLKTPMSEFGAKAEQNSANFSSANRMSIRVHQIGGDPAKIGLVLCPLFKGKKADANCKKSSKDVVDCGFGDISKCVNVIASAIAYTNSSEGENFPTQIADGKNYQVTTMETIPYVTLGEPFVEPPTNAELAVFEMSVQQINDLFKKQYDYWVTAHQFVMGSAPRLSDRQKAEMEPIENLHAKNATKIAVFIDNCLDSESVKACNEEVDNARTVVGLIDDPNAEEKQYKSIMDLTNAETFVQYCDIASSEFPEIEATVNALEVYAVTEAGGPAELDVAKGNRCWILADWLDKQKELNLAKYPELKIRDLSPIGALVRLEKLDLSNRDIESIEELARLVNLKELILDFNKITDLLPLGKMVKLERLSLQDNLIDSLADLKALATDGKLAKIDARGNSETLACPLKNAKGCKILSFADYSNISAASTKCNDIAYHESIAIDRDTILATGGRQFPNISAAMQVVRNTDCRQLEQTLSVPRLGHTMTMTKKGILVVGGGVDSMEYINPTTFANEVIEFKMPAPIYQHSATLLTSGDVLVVGGAIGINMLNEAKTPTGLSDAIYLVRESGVVELVGHLSVPRANHTATLLDDGSVLVIGGYSLNGMINIAEIISPETKSFFTLKKSLPVARMGHTAAKLSDGQVIIAGGFTWAEEINNGVKVQVQKATSSIVLFDPKTQNFTELEEQLIPARGNIESIVTTDQRVLLIGGQMDMQETAGGELAVKVSSSAIQVYDHNTEAMYSVGDLLNTRVGFTATSLGQNSVMIFGGQTALTIDENGTLVEEKMLTSSELLVYRPR